MRTSAAIGTAITARPITASAPACAARPHGTRRATHAIATPYAVGFNAPAAPEAMRRIERALGVKSAARGLYDLNIRLGLPTGLKDLGLKERDIDKAVEVVSAVKIAHPRPVSTADLREVIGQAFAGAPPRF